MKKFGSLLMAAILSAGLLAGCSSSAPDFPSNTGTSVPESETTSEIEATSGTDQTSDDTVIRIGGLKGPTTMGLVKLMDDAENGINRSHVRNRSDIRRYRHPHRRLKRTYHNGACQADGRR